MLVGSLARRLAAHTGLPVRRRHLVLDDRQPDDEHVAGELEQVLAAKVAGAPDVAGQRRLDDLEVLALGPADHTRATRQRLVGSPLERQRDGERGPGQGEARVEGDRRGQQVRCVGAPGHEGGDADAIARDRRRRRTTTAALPSASTPTP